ncbi:MAG: hypothetical protein R8G66_08975 [Cytophagales bacterium]|nr:hypothetical protein [Cytophagales bacterium]
MMKKTQFFQWLLFSGLWLISCKNDEQMMPEPEIINDRIEFPTQQIQGEIGLLVDGFVEPGPASLTGRGVNDRREITAAPDFELSGNFSDHTRNELIAFHSQYAPTLMTNVPWSEEQDIIPITLNERINLPVTFWVIAEPFDEMEQLIIDAINITNSIWASEKAGLRIDEIQINDMTSSADRDQFLNYTCGNNFQLTERIGFDPTNLNVYYVDAVDFGTGSLTSNGVFCGNNIIGMGRSTTGGLLAHEFGHAMGLAHPDQFDRNFDNTNVMFSSSRSREYLTEGQTFRQLYSPSSYVSISGLRTIGDFRICSHQEESTGGCPSIQKRIWSDGSFSAN